MNDERPERKAGSQTFGPGNPHPLAKLRTELVWEGKYDEYGNRRLTDVSGDALPMQRIETIDQPRSEAVARGQLELFERANTRLSDFRNRLIWGDNKLVMASLLQEFRGGIDLIYIDPPFDVGTDFTLTVPLNALLELCQANRATGSDLGLDVLAAERGPQYEAPRRDSD